MAYVAWSVVFGEQPSAAKWNILGSNDASFNDGTGLNAASIVSTKLVEAYVRGVRQDDNNNSITNTAVTDQKLKFGWGQIVGNGTGVLTGTVTFDTAFTTTPVVMGGMLAAKAGSAATNIGQLITANAASVTCQVEDITTTTFAVSLRLSSGSFGSGDYFGFWWQAIG